MKSGNLSLVLLVLGLVVSLILNVTLALKLVDQAVTLDGRTIYATDCEKHRDKLDLVLRATAHRSDVERIGGKDVSFQFDTKGSYLGSWYGSSTTEGFRHDRETQP